MDRDGWPPNYTRCNTPNKKAYCNGRSPKEHGLIGAVSAAMQANLARGKTRQNQGPRHYEKHEQAFANRRGNYSDADSADQVHSVKLVLTGKRQTESP